MDAAGASSDYASKGPFLTLGLFFSQSNVFLAINNHGTETQLQVAASIQTQAELWIAKKIKFHTSGLFSFLYKHASSIA